MIPASTVSAALSHADWRPDMGRPFAKSLAAHLVLLATLAVLPGWWFEHRLSWMPRTGYAIEFELVPREYPRSGMASNVRRSESLVAARTVRRVREPATGVSNNHHRHARATFRSSVLPTPHQTAGFGERICPTFVLSTREPAVPLGEEVGPGVMTYTTAASSGEEPQSVMINTPAGKPIASTVIGVNTVSDPGPQQQLLREYVAWSEEGHALGTMEATSGVEPVVMPWADGPPPSIGSPPSWTDSQPPSTETPGLSRDGPKVPAPPVVAFSVILDKDLPAEQQEAVNEYSQRMTVELAQEARRVTRENQNLVASGLARVEATVSKRRWQRAPHVVSVDLKNTSGSGDVDAEATALIRDCIVRSSMPRGVKTLRMIFEYSQTNLVMEPRPALPMMRAENPRMWRLIYNGMPKHPELIRY